MNTDTLPETFNEQPPTSATRESLARAQERARELYEQAREKVAVGARTTDETIRSRPYESIAIAFGVGALVGWLISRKKPTSYEQY